MKCLLLSVLGLSCLACLGFNPAALPPSEATKQHAIPAGSDNFEVPNSVNVEVLEWAVREGCRARCSIEWDKETPQKGWGLKAAHSFSPGEEVISVPGNLCISVKEDLCDSGWTADHDLRTYWDKVEGLAMGPPLGSDCKDNMKLALAVLSERAKEGRWTPWLSSLRRENDGIPLFYDAGEVGALRDVALMERIKATGRFIQNFADQELTSKNFKGVKVDANTLAWGMATVTSRGIFLEGTEDAAPPPRTIVPLLDYANHAAVPNAKVVAEWCNDKLKQVNLVAVAPVKRGDWLEVNYGSHPSSHYLFDYGIPYPYNPRERVQFKFDAQMLKAARAIGSVLHEEFASSVGENRIHQWQQRYLKQLKLDGFDADYLLDIGPQSNDGRALAALRVLFAQKESELEGRSIQDLQKGSEIISNVNERRVLSTLSGLCSVILRTFGSTLSDDEEFLYVPNTQAQLYSSDESQKRWLSFLANQASHPNPRVPMNLTAAPSGDDDDDNDIDLANLEEKEEKKGFHGYRAGLSWNEILALSYSIGQRRALSDTIAAISMRLQAIGTIDDHLDVDAEKDRGEEIDDELAEEEAKEVDWSKDVLGGWIH